MSLLPPPGVPSGNRGRDQAEVPRTHMPAHPDRAFILGCHVSWRDLLIKEQEGMKKGGVQSERAAAVQQKPGAGGESIGGPETAKQHQRVGAFTPLREG